MVTSERNCFYSMRMWAELRTEREVVFFTLIEIRRILYVSLGNSTVHVFCLISCNWAGLAGKYTR